MARTATDDPPEEGEDSSGDGQPPKPAPPAPKAKAKEGEEVSGTPSVKVIKTKTGPISFPVKKGGEDTKALQTRIAELEKELGLKTEELTTLQGAIHKVKNRDALDELFALLGWDE